MDEQTPRKKPKVGFDTMRMLFLSKVLNALQPLVDRLNYNLTGRKPVTLDDIRISFNWGEDGNPRMRVREVLHNDYDEDMIEDIDKLKDEREMEYILFMDLLEEIKDLTIPGERERAYWETDYWNIICDIRLEGEDPKVEIHPISGFPPEEVLRF